MGIGEVGNMGLIQGRGLGCNGHGCRSRYWTRKMERLCHLSQHHNIPWTQEVEEGNEEEIEQTIKYWVVLVNVIPQEDKEGEQYQFNLCQRWVTFGIKAELPLATKVDGAHCVYTQYTKSCTRGMESEISSREAEIPNYEQEVFQFLHAMVSIVCWLVATPEVPLP
eukprot:8355342-Ditylum_brightwellii.AAC.1